MRQAMWRVLSRGKKTKAASSSRNGRKSPGQRLGVKTFGGHIVFPGNVLVRQRGTKFHPGENVRRGRDDTLYSIGKGFVVFSKCSKRVTRGMWSHRQLVNVLPRERAYPYLRDHPRQAWEDDL